jgi:hypothetical protein
VSTEDEAELEPPADPWTYTTATLAFEIQPLGGGEAVTVLSPHRTYELHYTADCEAVRAYVLTTETGSAASGVSEVEPAPQGDWAGTGFFGFTGDPQEAIEADESVWVQRVYDDFGPDLDAMAGATGHLCNFTTGDVGELRLSLDMGSCDVEALQCVVLWSEAVFSVEEFGD